MKSFARFWHLPTRERYLLFNAFFHLAAARLALWIFPLKRIQTLKTLKVSETFRVSPPPEKIAWAIHAIGRRLPGLRNCLVQALAGQMLLARYGHASQLRIGVTRNENGQFKAHAWVEYGGQIIIGATGAAQYTALPPLEFQRHEP